MAHVVGYDVKLVKNAPARYKCTLCRLLLREPIQTFRGELACASCYRNARRENPSVCPVDGEPIDDTQIFQDKHTNREILQLECYCNNNDNGCPWKGSVSIVEAHVEDCEYIITTCGNCGARIVKVNLNDHMMDSCTKRGLKCPYCQMELEADLIKDHQATCIMKPRECPYKCGQAVLHSELFNHVQVCPKLESGSTCPFQIVGCNSKAFTSKKNLEKHLQSDVAVHAALTVSNVGSMKRQNEHLQLELVKEQSARAELEATVLRQANEVVPLKTEVLKLQNTLSEMTNEISESRKRIDEKTNRLAEDVEIHKNLTNDDSIKAIQEQMAVVDSQYMEFERKLRSLDAKGPGSNFGGNAFEMRRDLDQYASKIDMIETNNAVLSANLSDLELKLQLLENTNYDGRQLWKIDNVRHRMQQAVTGKVTALHSAPCFTCRAGYKFCSRLYLNGDGMGKGTHLSLFFVVMRSEYDALLDWPFSHRVTFRLINHTSPRESIRETFLPDRNSSSFRKPTRDMNIAAGCPMFIQKEALFAGGFIIDDSLFIETTVTTGT